MTTTFLPALESMDGGEEWMTAGKRKKRKMTNKATITHRRYSLLVTFVFPIPRPFPTAHLSRGRPHPGSRQEDTGDTIYARQPPTPLATGMCCFLPIISSATTTATATTTTATTTTSTTTATTTTDTTSTAMIDGFALMPLYIWVIGVKLNTIIMMQL